MYSILKYGGLTTGGVNFDAKVRRESFEPIDLFYAHIGGMDAFARGLKIAAAIREDGKLDELVRDRYASWDKGLGQEIESGKHDFASLEKLMLEKGDAAPNRSGRQEMIENLDQHVSVGRGELAGSSISDGGFCNLGAKRVGPIRRLGDGSVRDFNRRGRPGGVRPPGYCDIHQDWVS